MLEMRRQGKISIEEIVRKMCHAPAQCFDIDKRGYLDEGYWADVVIVDPDASWQVSKPNLLYKCGWSPLEGQDFHERVLTTLVNGNVVWHNGQLREDHKGMRIEFNR